MCEEHHIQAEQTILSCDELREKCGINHIILPDHFYRDQAYDKWGNPILPNGNRLAGDLFNDESVQKILNPVLHLFVKYTKYPRTYHLPWSPGVTKDDRIIADFIGFKDQEVVVTVKLDGENTSFYNDYMHARSLDYEHHPSRSRVRALHAQVASNIPAGYKVCGENVYAKHSISYSNLDDYFLMFSIWNEKNICLSWDETIEWAELLELKTVPVLYRGIWDEKIIKSLHKDTYNGDQCEGYVCRIADQFGYSAFRKVVAKYVRANHVQTSHHWKHNQLEINKLKT